MQKQILVNLPKSSWVVLNVNSNIIVHPNFNCPNLKNFDWFSQIEDNFFLLKEFFETLHKPNITLDHVNDLKKVLPGMYTVNLIANLEPLLNFWKKSILLECLQCKILRSTCVCILYPQFPCGKMREHSTRKCMECDKEMVGAHFLKIDFLDYEKNSIIVSFSQKSMDVFLNDFPCQRVVSQLDNHIDFVNTLRWHVEHEKYSQPFISTMVVKKKIINSESNFFFISGPLKPIVDGKRYEIYTIPIV